MADDLLEEIEGEDEIQEEQQEDTADKSEKTSLLKRLLGNRKRLIIICSTLFLILGAAGGVYFFFFSGEEELARTPESIEMTEENIQAALEQEPEVIFEDIVVLEPFERITMKSSSAMKQISLVVSLELTDPNFRRLVVPVEGRLRKIIEGQIKEMTWLELRNPEGKIRLKYELLKRMNNVFPKVTIRNIYFTNFLMQ